MNYRLIRQNFLLGRAGEIKWIKILRKQYPSIIDNNEKDRYSSMDACSVDNDILIEHELKCRKITHNQYRGLMVNKCKIDKSIINLNNNIRQIYYWSCLDGLYYWELYDFEKQKNELIFYKNGNKSAGLPITDVVDIKTKYLTKYEF
tara:strand:+ start:341 stop:781 length:441 start_codon:yes stop_codon:yes gene_type:complete